MCHTMRFPTVHRLTLAGLVVPRVQAYSGAKSAYSDFFGVDVEAVRRGSTTGGMPVMAHRSAPPPHRGQMRFELVYRATLPGRGKFGAIRRHSSQRVSAAHRGEGEHTGAAG